MLYDRVSIQYAIECEPAYPPKYWHMLVNIYEGTPGIVIQF